MKKIATRSLAICGIMILAILVFSFFVPTAQAEPRSFEKYQPLEALPNARGEISTGSINVNDFFTTVYFFSLTAAVFLSVIMIIYGGLQYMARGVSEAVAKGAKDRIFNALKGLLLALLSYLILYTINPDLIEPRLFVPETTGVRPDGSGAQGGGTTPGGGTSGGGGSRGGGSVPGDTFGKFMPSEYEQGISNTELVQKIRADEARVRSALGSNFVTNHPEDRDGCNAYGDPNCTSLGLLPAEAINRLKLLQNDCNCQITINGATEWWHHEEHGPGRPIVDLNHTSQLDSYLRSKGTGRVVVIDGVGSFVNEDKYHWHVYLKD